MRGKNLYIYQQADWPKFTWSHEKLAHLLAEVWQRQGRLLGRMEALDIDLQHEATLETLTLDILKSCEIEGEVLDAEQIRSSIARRLGMDIAGLVPSNRNTEGIVEMMLDATQNYEQALTNDRLFSWYAALFPGSKRGKHKNVVGAWRDNTEEDPMQVVSGAIGNAYVHFEAPAATILEDEMNRFMAWFNDVKQMDAIVKAAIAHLWFVTIHPFDDGNGRITRAIADMQLTRADGTSQRFYSMSAQIRKERKDYYTILEETQKGSLDITTWVKWFLECLHRALMATDETLATVLKKVKFWERHATTIFNERQKLMINKLLDGIDGKLNTSKWAKVAKCSPDTALRDIRDLMDKEVLMKEKAGGRSTNYILTT